jgi:hypothetical protein
VLNNLFILFVGYFVFILVMLNEYMWIFSLISMFWSSSIKVFVFLVLNEFDHCIISVSCLVRCSTRFCACCQFIMGLMGLSGLCSFINDRMAGDCGLRLVSVHLCFFL